MARFAVSFAAGDAKKPVGSQELAVRDLIAAAVALLALRRGVLQTQVAAGLVGVIAALAGATLPS